MQPHYKEPAIDEASLRILLLLRSGQFMSVHEISQVLDLSMKQVWALLNSLEQIKLVSFNEEKGKFQITRDGAFVLLTMGYTNPKPIADKEEKEKHPYHETKSFWFVA